MIVAIVKMHQWRLTEVTGGSSYGSLSQLSVSGVNYLNDVILLMLAAGTCEEI